MTPEEAFKDGYKFQNAFGVVQKYNCNTCIPLCPTDMVWTKNKNGEGCAPNGSLNGTPVSQSDAFKSIPISTPINPLAKRITNYSVGLDNLDGHPEAYDFNKDGKTDIVDALYALQNNVTEPLKISIPTETKKAKYFFQKYWMYIIILILIIVVLMIRR